MAAGLGSRAAKRISSHRSALSLLVLLALATAGSTLPQLLGRALPTSRAAGCENADSACYSAQAAAALLGKYQDAGDGLFGDTLPWIEANAIESLCEWVLRMGGRDAPAVAPLWLNISAMLGRGGNVTQPQYPSGASDACGEPYCYSFDDQAWWGLAWAKAFELTNEPTHLWRAVRTFVYLRDMSWDETQCGGGNWWSGAHHYKNSITNQLFFSLAAQLHPLWNRHLEHGTPTELHAITQILTTGDNVTVESEAAYFKGWALKSWRWIAASGLRDKATGLFRDGLNSTQCPNITIYSNGTGSDGNDAYANASWTYNQGVVLAALGKLYEATADPSLLSYADSVVQAVLEHMTVPAGGVRRGVSEEDDAMPMQQEHILVEWACNTCYGCGDNPPGECADTGDGAMFKGAFLRNLGYLRRTPGLDFSRAAQYRRFALDNAQSAW